MMVINSLFACVVLYKYNGRIWEEKEETWETFPGQWRNNHRVEQIIISYILFPTRKINCLSVFCPHYLKNINYFNFILSISSNILFDMRLNDYKYKHQCINNRNLYSYIHFYKCTIYFIICYIIIVYYTVH